MKKLISAFIVLMMLVTSTVVFAVDAPGTDSADVYAKYVGTGRTDVYSVDIVWGGMLFDYNAAAEEWDSTTHTWVPTTGATWQVRTGSSNKIEVTNHSSVAVDIDMSTTNMMSGITGEFTNASFTLNIPSEGINGATVGSSTFMPKGALASTYTTDTVIGKIVVTVD